MEFIYCWISHKCILCAHICRRWNKNFNQIHLRCTVQTTDRSHRSAFAVGKRKKKIQFTQSLRQFMNVKYIAWKYWELPDGIHFEVSIQFNFTFFTLVQNRLNVIPYIRMRLSWKNEIQLRHKQWVIVFSGTNYKQIVEWDNVHLTLFFFRTIKIYDIVISTPSEWFDCITKYESHMET